MFTLSIRVYNPFSKASFTSADGFVLPVTKNKTLEINLYKDRTILSFELALETNCDHAGFRIEFGLFGRSIEFHFYDNRHLEDRV